MNMIRILTKEGCSKCNELKNYLSERNVEYETVNLSNKDNRDARKHYREAGYELLPVIEGDGWTIDGFNKNLLEELI